MEAHKEEYHLMTTHISLSYKLVPVEYREYEYGLFWTVFIETTPTLSKWESAALFRKTDVANGKEAKLNSVPRLKPNIALWKI